MTAREVGRLHVITDEVAQRRFSHLELARSCAAAGADCIQFRDKRPRATRELVETASRMVEVALEHGARVIVNDRADVAVAAGAAGVHLGRHDLEAEAARRILGPAAIVGATANSLEEAVRVAALPVDYLGVGPVYGTHSKANPAPRLGPEALRRIAATVDKPVIAIGGITAERVGEVLEAGAHGVAVLSAVARRPDPAMETRRIREAIDAWRAVGSGR